MIFKKTDGFNNELLQKPWRVLFDDHVEYCTYVELAKLVNSHKIPFSTRVTRRENDFVGTPVGELLEFTPVFFSKVKEKIAPPHTKTSHVRSFFRVEDTKEVFLKFSDKSRQCFILKTFGAGGACFKSKELIQAKHIVELGVELTIPNFKVLNGENFIAKGTVLDFYLDNDDYIYTFKFNNLESRKKVNTDKQCFLFSQEHQTV